MAVTLDQITHRKLVLTKQLFNSALVQAAASHSQVSKIIALISFDLANETAMKAVIGALDASKTPPDSFQGLIQKANELMGKSGLGSLPDQPVIQNVHSLRNDAQHKAKYPNDSDVNDSRTYTRDFLQHVVMQVWGVPFESMSVVDLVQHKEAKMFLVRATELIKEQEFRKASDSATAGLTWVLDRVQRAVVGKTPSFFTGFLMGRSLRLELDPERMSRDVEVDRDTLESFTKMQRVVLYQALGLNLVDYVRFELIAGNVVFYVNGHWSRHGGKETIAETEAEYILAYASSAIIEIEERAGDLDKPFGTDWYW